MRHKVRKKTFNRDTNHRRSMLKNLNQQIIINESLVTTVDKAKETRRQVEKLVNKAKDGSVHVRRQIMSVLFDKNAAHKLVDDLAVRYKDMPGGFLSLKRLGRRKGDNVMMAKLEFIKKQESEKNTKKK